MRFLRVSRPDGPAYAALHADGDHAILVEGNPFSEYALTTQAAPLEALTVLPPVLPSKILCVGKNYAAHAAEMDGEVPAEPLIFSKPSTSVIGIGEAIQLPSLSQEVHHEAELAVVIGRICKDVPAGQAADVIMGYTCANDVTARDLQRRDQQWTRSKGFDTFCPLGPWIDTDFDPAAGGDVICRVDGEERQRGSLDDLVFDVGELVAWCSAFATLLPGDVILTGTPAGVGPIAAGQTVDVEVEGLGTLRNPVEDAGP
ncbi:fumarylacetoacetate hydrolase family protein [Euzebya tangerina]|uniref:fumarylacetoacetate hydrolase family protein n=1 Tax=Euzebya tangerina TaxID=591198 RepID=UPI000E30D3E5|nr:fumarylacetoacetate hydrolase family protein [Euzebya tangerina]